MTEGHTRLLARVFRFLREPGGRIPEDFLAAHVKDIDRAEGDVETLLGRIAAIRTWTYISHRAAWVAGRALLAGAHARGRGPPLRRPPRAAHRRSSWTGRAR